MEAIYSWRKKSHDNGSQCPSHIFLQAGVGGMAVALAGYFRAWRGGGAVIVVEPERAGLDRAASSGRVCRYTRSGDMGRLDCKEPSLRGWCAAFS
jgi:diaminopropionate ammonia-lyase